MIGRVGNIIRILGDTAVFRLRRLEMANMVAVGAIAFALRHPWAEIAWRLAFAAGLNVLVYLNNDVHDVQQDLRSPDKDAKKTRFLADHLRDAWIAQAAMLGALTSVAVAVDVGLLVPLFSGGLICWLYSLWLKRMPGVDVLAMVVWGAAMPSVAFAPDSVVGWTVVGQLALFSGAFESMQVLRDRDDDVGAGVRTTAVVLGEAKTRWLVRLFVLGSAVYGGLFVHAIVGWMPALALVLTFKKPARDWNRLRLILGLAFVSSLYFLWSDGALAGLLDATV